MSVSVDKIPFPLYGYSELEKEESQSMGQTADLRREETHNGVRLRYWTERIDTLDGAPYDKTVSVEANVNGRWTEVFQYDGARMDSGLVKDEAALAVIR